jgi:hypothetical protein
LPRERASCYRFDQCILCSPIERYLKRMPLKRDALMLAMRQFGTDFELAVWQRAYEAFSAEEHNRVMKVTGNRWITQSSWRAPGDAHRLLPEYGVKLG